jgi:diadenosine tetraphosphate (Ap4A) HIT family hydrolase
VTSPLEALPALRLPGGLFQLEAADFCAWPGYALLRPASGVASPAAFSPAEAAALGPALARVVAALEAATGAERVYLLAFAEVDRRFHLHLLPRTRLLARGWAAAAGIDPAAPVDGPALFVWTRTHCVTAADLPPGAPDRAVVWGELARRWTEDTGGL